MRWNMVGFTRRARGLRRVLIATVVAAGAVVVVPLAVAVPPVITPAPQSDFVDSSTCGFPVSLHFVRNDETQKEFSSGKVLITGALSVEFSANGKTVGINISGPIQVTLNGASVTIEGRGVGAGPTLLPDGSVTIGYTAGPTSIDPATSVATLQHGRFLLDVCAALAV
jgi:hypothetical protein